MLASRLLSTIELQKDPQFLEARLNYTLVEIILVSAGFQHFWVAGSALVQENLLYTAA